MSPQPPRIRLIFGALLLVLLLASLEFFPMAPFVIWVAATALVLARRPFRIPQPLAG